MDQILAEVDASLSRENEAMREKIKSLRRRGPASRGSTFSQISHQQGANARQ
jgi:hypothetical protein